MPRASTSEDVPAKKLAAIKTVKKTAKKSVKKTTKKSVKKTTKKTTPRVKKDKPVEAVAITRKAPTNIMSKTSTKFKFAKKLAIGLGVLMVIVGGSVAFGVSDSGEIDVSVVVEEKIEERIQRAIDAGESPSSVVIPKDTTAKTANGGLRGKGKPDAPTLSPDPVVESVSDTSTSTEAVATSTDSGTEDTTDVEETIEETVETQSEEEIVETTEPDTTTEEPTN